MPRIIRQSVTLPASPKEVYEVLMDSRKHSRFTESKARVSRRVGGSFSAYDGYITGVNLELVPNRKIVQSWRGSDWPKNQYSRATFSLRKIKRGTKLTFRQSGVPDRFFESIKQGWIDFYWMPLRSLWSKSRTSR